MNILTIIGHPKQNSFTSAIAHKKTEQYIKEGHQVEILDLSQISFNPIMTDFKMELEPDLKKAQEMISRANHIIIATPIWWSTYPALLKGFFDRILLPGFAFQYGESPRPEKLLVGKTAELILLSDAPIWVRRFLQKDPAATILKRDILGFCGIKTRKVHRYGNILNLDESARKAILEKA